MIGECMASMFLDLCNFGHVETLYKQNPNKNNVDIIESKFYDANANIEVRMKFFDDGRRDDWELRETELDRYVVEEDNDD